MNEPEMQRILWRKYILGELPKAEADRMEALMRADDRQFELYMEEFQSVESELPTLPDEERFASDVMARLPGRRLNGAAEGKRKQWRWDRPVLHYVIAASITFLLLGGGVFDLLAAGTSAAVEHQGSGAPLSEQLLERASLWMDRIKPAAAAADN
ncbi:MULTISPECIES: hypothetical protein [Paenibacillus]|uniref:hypothetical protein n=1 Tax=Paenibacillus TaxID=44249 RepID=UPI002FE1655A